MDHGKYVTDRHIFVSGCGHLTLAESYNLKELYSANCCGCDNRCWAHCLDPRHPKKWKREPINDK